MNIIIEGPDCSGKSTLIKTIFNDQCIIHNGVYRSPKLAHRAYMDQIPSNQMCRDNPYIVWDRQYISEQIYGSIYRNACMFKDQVDAIELKHRFIKTIVIVCNPGTDTIMTEWARRRNAGQEYVEQLDCFEQIVDVYTNKFDSICNLPFFEFNYLTDDISSIKDRIKHLREVSYA